MRPSVFLTALFIASASALPVHASSVTRGVASVRCSAPLRLSLRPGPVPGAYVRNGPPARDIPPGPLVVHLPLYPAAAYSASRFPSSSFQVLPPAYRKVGVASFALPAGYSHVSSWYRGALAACGYRGGEEMPLQQHGGPRYGSLFFTSRWGLHWLTLTLRPISPRLTLVRYVMQTLDLPPRPAASYLHGPFVRVSVLYRSVGAVPAKNRTYRFTITWPATIARLVAAVNRPTDISVGLIGGAGLVLTVERAVLSFLRTDGGARQVRVGGALDTLVVGHTRALDDTNAAVLRLVDRLVARRCREPQSCASIVR